MQTWEPVRAQLRGKLAPLGITLVVEPQATSRLQAPNGHAAS